MEAEAVAERRKKARHRAVPLSPEFRFWNTTGLEVRSAGKTDEAIVTGSPIMYQVPYTVRDAFGEFEETMMPGVVTEILPSATVHFLYDHDGLTLAKSKNDLALPPTLVLRDSPSSLNFEARLDMRQQVANDLVIAIERGDISQMSCGFIVAEDEWNDDWDERIISRFEDLLDISAVKFPASTSTHISVAHRMALAMPVESRARLRKRYLHAKQTGDVNEALEALRPILDLEERDVDVDPGEDTQTPTGTGRLGSPDGDGDTYADAGTDGSVGGGGPGDSADASGTRSDDLEVEDRDEAATDAPEDGTDKKTSRAKALQLRAKALKASLDA